MALLLLGAVAALRTIAEQLTAVAEVEEKDPTYPHLVSWLQRELGW